MDKIGQGEGGGQKSRKFCGCLRKLNITLRPLCAIALRLESQFDGGGDGDDQMSNFAE